MSVLALDWGSKYVGYATGDNEGIVVTPQGYFERKIAKEKMWILSEGDEKELSALVDSYGVSAIVLGLPLHADGRESEMSQGARSLAEKLKKEFSLDVHLVDERFTSSGRNDHAKAAATLLQDYFDQRERKAKSSGEDS